MLWISSPATTTVDETAGAKLTLSDESAGDEEADQRDDSGAIDALAKALKGQALGRRQLGVEIGPITRTRRTAVASTSTAARLVGPPAGTPVSPSAQLVLRRKRSVFGPMKKTSRPAASSS